MLSKIKSSYRADRVEKESDSDSLVGVVSALGPQLPTDFPVGQSWSTKWIEALNWAAKAWRTVYYALTMRKSPAFRSQHPIEASPAESFIRKLARLYIQENAIQWLKFHTTYLFARHAKQEELPTCPTCALDDIPGILGGGWVYLRCRTLMQGRERDLGAAADILYSKYGMPKAPDSFILKSLREHRQVLTRKVPIVDSTMRVSGAKVPSLTITSDSLKKNIRKVVKAIFSNSAYTPRVCVPTQSACFERSSAKGGQLAELRDQFNKSPFCPDYLEVGSVVGQTELLRIVEPLPGVIEEERTDPLSECLVSAFQRFLRQTVSDSVSDPVKARSFGICEPLKCRVITEAEAAQMCFVTSLQKHMHDELRKCQIFQFIGKPDTERRIAKCLGSALEEDEEYVSGDYSAATDNLNSEISAYCWDCICDYSLIPSLERQVGHKCLTKHLLFMSKQDPAWREDMGSLQENGQCMGSPMSFPILCIVNAAIFGLAYDYCGGDVLRAPVRVNGDDIVFRGRKDRYDLWWRLNGMVGFLPSKGKNYRSSRFVNINSHTYLKVRGEGSDPWKRVAVVNSALLQRIIRKGPCAGERNPQPWMCLKANYDWLVEGFKPRTVEGLRKVFVQGLDVPEEVPLDLPTRCGGPGFGCGAYSDDARMLSSLFLTRKDPFSFLGKRPTLLDNSKVAECLRDWSDLRTRTEVTYDRPKDPYVRVERGGAMGASDVLGQLLLCEEEPGRKLPAQSDQPWKDVVVGPYQHPSFLRKVKRYNRNIASFYSSGKVWAAFSHIITGLNPDDPERLHLADEDTCVALDGNWQKVSVRWNSNVVRLGLKEINFWSDVERL